MINGALLIAPKWKIIYIPHIRQQETLLSRKKMSNFKQGAAARYIMIWNNDLMSTACMDFWEIIRAHKVAPIHQKFYCTHTTVYKKRCCWGKLSHFDWNGVFQEQTEIETCNDQLSSSIDPQWYNNDSILLRTPKGIFLLKNQCKMWSMWADIGSDVLKNVNDHTSSCKCPRVTNVSS